MSSKGNIAGFVAGSNQKDSSLRCPYCGSSRLWKHGRYQRKGFHYRDGAGVGAAVAVQRSLCRAPSCERTFSILPHGVLPICRFYLDGLIRIAAERTAGRSLYGIAKHVWGVTVRTVQRTVALIGRAAVVLERMCREAGGDVVSDFTALVNAAREMYGARDFARAWLRGLYPCRFGTILNPHNLGGIRT